MLILYSEFSYPEAPKRRGKKKNIPNGRINQIKIVGKMDILNQPDNNTFNMAVWNQGALFKVKKNANQNINQLQSWRRQNNVELTAV